MKFAFFIKQGFRAKFKHDVYGNFLQDKRKLMYKGKVVSDEFDVDNFVEACTDYMKILRKNKWNKI